MHRLRGLRDRLSHGSRSLGPEGLRYEEKTCTACGACADVCFTGALELCGREYSVDEVLGEVLQDPNPIMSIPAAGSPYPAARC